MYKDPEQRRQYARDYQKREYLSDPGKFKERVRKSKLKKVYGLTLERFNELLAAQGGACALCGTKDPGKVNWHVDHDHSTGAVRGLLCNPCNGTKVGANTIVTALAVLDYLRKSNVQGD